MEAMFTNGRNYLLGAYSAANVYDANKDVGTLPLTAADAANVLASNDLDLIRAQLAILVKYEKDVRAYYDTRVSRTSGGKRDRLRNERRDLTGEALNGIQILKTGLMDLERKIYGTTLSTQSDFDPNTGARRAESVDKPEESGQGSDSSSAANMSGLVLPIGAALAALYFLKGN